MTAVSRRNTRAEHPRRKHKQNCLSEFPKGKSGDHRSINEQGPLSCQLAESPGSAPATVEDFQDLIDLVLPVFLRARIEGM
ncbi:MAG: hypothetical protein KIS73_18185, partial [Enhydrobacter sp.]|nr:hypothetical protein [Enhydrobacter sp.]